MATEQRLIDANRIPYHKSGFPKGDGFDSRLDWAFREDIDNAPTVDAVEVVRCKECKGWCTEEIAKQYGVDRYCTMTMMPTDADDFCSYGERRTDEPH